MFSISFILFFLAGFSSQQSQGFNLESRIRQNASTFADDSTRRNFFVSAAVIGGLLSSAIPVTADTGAEVRGISVNPFNGLMFQYRGSDFGGLKVSNIDEPSVSYADFIGKLRAGQVEFVEFFAPDGDVAYATFKGEKPIRIGEGYPVEQHDGYSSPSFAIRAVKNAGVPYKFTVPGLN